MVWFLSPLCCFLLFPTLHHPCPRAGSGREPHKWHSPSAGAATTFWPALFCSVLSNQGQLCSLTLESLRFLPTQAVPCSLFAFHQLGSADFSAEFSAEFAFWVLGGEGGCREQLLRAVNEWHIRDALGEVHEGCLVQLHRKLSAQHGCGVVVQELKGAIRRWGKILA